MQEISSAVKKSHSLQKKTALIKQQNKPIDSLRIYQNGISFLEKQFADMSYEKPYALSSAGQQLLVWVVSGQPFIIAALPQSLISFNKYNKDVVPLREYESEFIEFKVRVLLDEKEHGNDQIWELTNKKGFSLIDLSNPDDTKKYYQKKIVIHHNNGSLFINDKKVQQKYLKIDPLEEYIGFNDNHYRGSFIVIHDNQKTLLINQIELEDYVACVLNAESWPGWPLEVNKAFAIASRTYLAHKVLEATAAGLSYHIKNTNIHQTYNGIHSSDLLKKAVEQTKGLIVTYNKKPILAMFDSCCGGIIPAHMSGIDFKHTPYLARKIPCTFCKSCKLYSWKLEYTLAQLEEILQEAEKPLKNLQDIRIIKKDKAGVVHKVACIGKPHELTFTGQQFYSLLSKVKSYCYSIEKKGKKIIIQGRGYGHNRGICQWGARNMVDEGWNYRSILSFYYPGTLLMKLRPVIYKV